MLRTLSRACSYRRCIGRFPTFGARPMSSIIHRTTSDAKYPFYDLDDSDQRLIQASSKMEEEDICIPFPYGPDFLDVQVGEVLPPAEDESDWGVQYVACDENANKRVRILRKLGYGADASVWMGYEEPVGPNGREYVAVKVFSLAATEGLPSSADHNEVLTNVPLSAPSQHPGASHIVKPHWHAIMKQSVHPNFTIRADRLMSVMEVCGPSLKMTQQRINGHFPFAPWKKIFRDMLLALDYLHEEKHLVHGNLMPSDILLVLSPSLSLQAFAELAEEPQRYYLPFVDAKMDNIATPTYIFQKDLLARDPGEHGSLLRDITGKEPRLMPLFEPNRMSIHWTTERRYKNDGGRRFRMVLDKEMDWKLCDFGSASPKPIDGQFAEPLPCNPRRQAPEFILGLPWDEKIDIWTLGCVMFEVLANKPLFRGPPDSDWPPMTIPRGLEISQERLEEVKEFCERYDPVDHLVCITALLETPVPLWMVRAFQDAKRNESEDAEEEEVFDYATGKLLNEGPADLRISDEERTILKERHPWLGREGQKDELLFDALSSLSTTIAYLESVGDRDRTEPTDPEDVRDAVDMIKRCLTMDPRKRPSAKELLEDPFFK